MVNKDPYSVLGLKKEASQSDIKNAYRELAKKFHPDLNPGIRTAEANFKEINDAYERIGTPESREKFDQGEAQMDSLNHAPHQGFNPDRYYQTQRGGSGGRYSHRFAEEAAAGLAGMENTSGINEGLFESIFGQSHRGSAQDPVFELEISLSESVHGSEREVQFPFGKKLRVKIPKGIDDGMTLRFAGAGAPDPQGGPPGNILLRIRVKDDPRFRKVGRDLFLDVPISLQEAVFGGEVRVRTFDGEVELKVPPHSNTGTRLKLRGKGLYDSEIRARKDLIVTLQVHLPKVRDVELEHALADWQRKHQYNPREEVAA